MMAALTRALLNTKPLLAMTLLVVAACAPVDTAPPGRITFPGQTSVEKDVKSPGREERPLIAIEDNVDDSLFAPVRNALAAGDWMAATLALPEITSAELPTVNTVNTTAEVSAETNAATVTAPSMTMLWIDYYRARIALLRGDLETHATIWNNLKQYPLSPALYAQILETDTQQSQLNGSAAEAFTTAFALLRFRQQSSADAASIAAAESTVWWQAQRVSEQPTSPSIASTDADARAWIDLARATHAPSSPAILAALTAWSESYSDHVALDLASTLRQAVVKDTQTSELVLLLPLSGQLERAGQAVSEGVFAAYYDDQQSSLSVSVLDSRRFENIEEAYRLASRDAGAIVVGPLGKLQVEALLQSNELPTPVLALNRPEGSTSGHPDTLELSLAPEDEASQLAELAFAAGIRRPLLMRPEGVWGNRMESALNSRWQSLGGQTAVRAVFGQPSGYSQALEEPLGLSVSNRRGVEIRRLFEPKVETQNRRRQDIDAVFLLCKSADEARALKPLLNYHYAGDLPVYALSTADTGMNDPDFNRDLNGLQLLAMPWRIGDGGVPGLSVDRPGGFAALHALGVDAYHIAKRWHLTRATPAIRYSGYTAELKPSNGVLMRRLELAEFDRGVLSSP